MEELTRKLRDMESENESLAQEVKKGFHQIEMLEGGPHPQSLHPSESFSSVLFMASFYRGLVYFICVLWGSLALH